MYNIMVIIEDFIPYAEIGRTQWNFSFLAHGWGVRRVVLFGHGGVGRGVERNDLSD